MKRAFFIVDTVSQAVALAAHTGAVVLNASTFKADLEAFKTGRIPRVITTPQLAYRGFALDGDYDVFNFSHTTDAVLTQIVMRCLRPDSKSTYYGPLPRSSI